MHTVVRRAWIGLAIAVALVLVGMGATYLTAAPALCASCHEMAPAVASWSQSPHSVVGCPSCHEQSRPWYRFPETLILRVGMLTRDTAAHVSEGGSQEGTVTVPDSACEQCHDPSRKVTMRYGTLIDHQEHARRNKSCQSCHIWTAHPRSGAEKPLLLMEQCFTCHGTPGNPMASGTCVTCHPASFDKRPASHGPAAWKVTHGKVAMAGEQKCTMCHTAAFCTDCHGLAMPHPAGWERGKTGHGATASKGEQVCVKCHTERPDPCAKCHHQDFKQTKGTWIEQHPDVVEQRGVLFCLKCHEPTHCVKCHTRPGVLDKAGAK